MGMCKENQAPKNFQNMKPEAMQAFSRSIISTNWQLPFICPNVAFLWLPCHLHAIICVRHLLRKYANTRMLSYLKKHTDSYQLPLRDVWLGSSANLSWRFSAYVAWTCMLGRGPTLMWADMPVRPQYRNWVVRSGHTERCLPQRTAVSVRCGMLHSKQTLLTIIFWKHSS